MENYNNNDHTEAMNLDQPADAINHLLEAKLKAKTIQFRTVLDTLPDYIFIKDTNGVYIACNKACEAYFGYPEREIVGKTDFDLVNQSTAESFIAKDLQAIELGRSISSEEWLTLKSNGNTILSETIKTPMYDEDGELLGIVGVARDITDRRKLEEKLIETNDHLSTLVSTDTLTGIGNRRAYDTRLQQEWQRCARDKTPLCLIIFDVDYFKQYNDTYGHKAGDNCLVALAQFLQSEDFVRRPSDFLARYGGEEFAIILGNCSAEHAHDLAKDIINRVREELAIPHSLSQLALSPKVLTISAGVGCIVPSHDLSPTLLFTNADKALYEAKKSGRNRTSLAVHETALVR